MVRLIFVLIGLLCYISTYAQPTRVQLLRALGTAPAVPGSLQVDTLERTLLAKGTRYLIRFMAEDASESFHTPADYIQAYVFVPKLTNQKIPGIVAIHQDGAHDGLGKKEPAGLAGDADQHYGIELFERGYMVICPDRFYHGSRRRIPNADSTTDGGPAGEKALSRWAGQLLLNGRNAFNKEAYDLKRTMDVFVQSPGLDTSRIGAIGHSAGGNAMTYFMFLDPRIKAGASSCGIFEVAEWYDEDAPRPNDGVFAMPGLKLAGSTADFIGHIAPRPFLLTRGLTEWGNADSIQKRNSAYHVRSTERMEAKARSYYRNKNVNAHLRSIYFTEAGGAHAFPPEVKAQVYAWLDQQLLRK